MQRPVTLTTMNASGVLQCPHIVRLELKSATKLSKRLVELQRAIVVVHAERNMSLRQVRCQAYCLFGPAPYLIQIGRVQRCEPPVPQDFVLRQTCDSNGEHRITRDRLLIPVSGTLEGFQLP